MPPAVHIMLVMFAVVCFVAASFPPTAPYWNRLVSIGLASWALSQLPL